MTVVVGFNAFSEVVMIADTRVSWPNNTRPSQDVLQKLYPIVGSRKAAVFGFCGNIEAAKTVMVHLKERKFKRIERHFVIVTLKDYLQRWIEEVTTTQLEPEARAKLSFILGGIEPSRHPPIKRGTKITGFLRFPEVHIYVYTVNEDNGKVAVSKRSGFAVIGSGRELEKEIEKKVYQGIRFGFKQPNLHWARTFLIGDVIASLFKENQSVTVGGPFQTIRITPTGLEESYIWPPNAKWKNVEIQREATKTTIYNPVSNEKYTVYPVWELSL